MVATLLGATCLGILGDGRPLHPTASRADVSAIRNKPAEDSEQPLACQSVGFAAARSGTIRTASSSGG
eukprot:5356026-Alexandrium_andersonii.AAC.1